MHAHLPHHDGGLGFVLVGLHHALISLGVLLEPLVSLREGVVVNVTGLVVAIAAEVRLGPLGLLHLHVDALDLSHVI